MRTVGLAVLALACRGSPAGEHEDAARHPPPPQDAPPAPSCDQGGQCQGPFVFRKGAPADALHDYAIATWGDRGDTVFTSAATVHAGDVTAAPGDEALIDLQRYAVIDVRQRAGFWIRDFGEHARVESMAATAVTSTTANDLVLYYWIDDDDRRRGYSHRVLEIWSFIRPDPALRFAHEVATVALCCGSEANAAPNVRDDVAIEPGAITLRARSAWRARAATWSPHPLPGIPATIAPWDAAKTRVFRWSGDRFSE